jgi:hypothetical protein
MSQWIECPAIHLTFWGIPNLTSTFQNTSSPLIRQDRNKDGTDLLLQTIVNLTIATLSNNIFCLA